jgi:hypothetical protein
MTMAECAARTSARSEDLLSDVLAGHRDSSPLAITEGAAVTGRRGRPITPGWLNRKIVALRNENQDGAAIKERSPTVMISGAGM